MHLLRARRRPGGCGYGEASPRPGQRRRHPALAVIAPLAHPPAARRSRRPFPPGRAGREPGALRADAGYLAGQLARAAPGEHIAFAIGARPIAPQGGLPDGAAQDDWRQAAGTGAARAAVADYRPGWCPTDAPLLIRRARAALLTGRCGEPTVALGKTGLAGAADRDV